MSVSDGVRRFVGAPWVSPTRAPSVAGPQVEEKGREEGRKCVGRGCGETGPSSGLSTLEVARFLFVLSTFNPSPQSAEAEGKRRRGGGGRGEVEWSGKGRGGRRG